MKLLTTYEETRKMEITIKRNINTMDKSSHYYFIKVTEGCHCETFHKFDTRLSCYLNKTVFESDQGIFTEGNRKITFRKSNKLEVEVRLTSFTPDRMSLQEIKDSIISRMKAVEEAFRKVEIEEITFDI